MYYNYYLYILVKKIVRQSNSRYKDFIGSLYSYYYDTLSPIIGTLDQNRLKKSREREVFLCILYAYFSCQKFDLQRFF